MANSETIGPSTVDRVKTSPGPLPAIPIGTISNLACKCVSKNGGDFLVKQDRIVCARCGNVILCTPPVISVCEATCACCWSPAIKTTFVLDSKGMYTCTWCGLSR